MLTRVDHVEAAGINNVEWDAVELPSQFMENWCYDAGTMLASASGAFGAYLYMKLRFDTPDVSMLCNGMLAGLVAITAPCAFVTAPASIFIGLVAGVLVVVSAMFIENVLKIDDPVGASSVHGTCGAWGIISLGLFADGRYGDGWNGVAGPGSRR